MTKESKCSILKNGAVIFEANREKNLYVLYLEELKEQNVCLAASKDKSTELWHRRLGHCSIDGMRKLLKKNLVEGLPKVSTKLDGVCKPCAKGKHTKGSFKSKTVVTTSRPLELLHMDLFGLMRTTSLGEKNFGFVIVDDYSRFT